MGCVSSNALTINILVEPAYRAKFMEWFDATYPKYKTYRVIDQYLAVVCVPNTPIIYWPYYTYSAALVIVYGEQSCQFVSTIDRVAECIDSRRHTVSADSGRNGDGDGGAAIYMAAISAACRDLQRFS